MAASAADSRHEPGLVCFAAVDWWYHNRAHSDVQLARCIAAERPVLLVNSIGLRIPRPGNTSQPWRRVTRKLASYAKGPRTPLPDTPNFHVFTPIALPLPGNPVLRRLSALLVRWQVQAVAHWYGMTSPHVLVTIPTAVDVLRGMARSSLIFNRSDLHSAFPEVNGPAVAALEHELLTIADAVIYVSHELMTKDEPVVRGRPYFLGHGIDVEHFRRVAVTDQPAEVTAIPRPRIGFFGGIDDYVVDLDLIGRVAEENADAHVVLIGDATCDMSPVTAHANVHWLGMRPYEEIPAYGSAFDVGIMPWLDNEWIHFCNPVKLKEYLALGLPVVTTDFPELRELRPRVVVAEPDSFTAALREALALPLTDATIRQRRSLVEHDTWMAKAHELLALMDELVARADA